jgi:hypothetical protein
VGGRGCLAEWDHQVGVVNVVAVVVLGVSAWQVAGVLAAGVGCEGDVAVQGVADGGLYYSRGFSVCDCAAAQRDVLLSS